MRKPQLQTKLWGRGVTCVQGPMSGFIPIWDHNTMSVIGHVVEQEDAKLIIMAPALLEALEQAAYLMDKSGGFQDTVKLAYQTIKKARGE